MRSVPEVVVEDSAAQLAECTAARTVETLAAALAQRPAAHLVVTGGGILEAVLDAIGRSAGDTGDVDWSRVHVWWGDERYVPADSDERNDKAAFATGFGSLAFDEANLHRMPAADAGFGDDVEAAADSYSAELANAADSGDDAAVPHFDLALIGIGPDGHCCSLFPGHPGLSELDTAAIAVHDSPKPPPTRISLSFTGLDAANEIWFVVAGDGKADAVARALGGADRDEVPSAGPRGRNRTLWLLDAAAAAKLPP